MTQFIPYNGVYVIARRHEGRTVLTILNGTSQKAVMTVDRYAEVIGPNAKGTDVITGRTVRLDHDLNLRPRQTLIVEF
jgi:hypothetical protein